MHGVTQRRRSCLRFLLSIRFVAHTRYARDSKIPILDLTLETSVTRAQSTSRTRARFSIDDGTRASWFSMPRVVSLGGLSTSRVAQSWKGRSRVTTTSTF